MALIDHHVLILALAAVGFVCLIVATIRFSVRFQDYLDEHPQDTDEIDALGPEVWWTP